MGSFMYQLHKAMIFASFLSTSKKKKPCSYLNTKITTGHLLYFLLHHMHMLVSCFHDNRTDFNPTLGVTEPIENIIQQVLQKLPSGHKSWSLSKDFGEFPLQRVIGFQIFKTGWDILFFFLHRFQM